MSDGAPIPPGGGRGMNIVMLLVLVLLIGGLVFWAYQRNPPTTPSRAGTATPEAMPGGGQNTS